MLFIVNSPHIFVFASFKIHVVGPGVHKSKWSFLFMHNWTTVYEAVRLETGGIRRCDFSMNGECECRVLV